jgi:putative hemolysin
MPAADTDRMKAIYLLPVAFLAACASSTGPILIGKDTYSIMTKSTTPTANLTDLKADAYKEASAFCAKQGKQLTIVNTSGVPRGFAQFPEAEVQFTCG